MNRTTRAAAAFAALLALIPASLRAEVRLHNLFTPGAVLQRGVRVPVWGTARDGEKVRVELAGNTANAVASGGKWMAWLRPMPAGGPYTLTVSGDNTVSVPNVLVGEVWICSGQSNMQWTVRDSADADSTIANSADPQLRLFTVPRKAEDAPQIDVSAAWEECNPQTVPGFSAVAYAFGKELRRILNVPVGLISTNYGGTPAEAWTRRAALESDPLLNGYITRHEAAVQNYPAALVQYSQAMDSYRTAAEKARAEGKEMPRAPQRPQDPARSASRPAGLYNAMIAPLIPYGFKGAIWYQGESNAGRAWEYRTLFPAMIRNWRADWNQGDFPFLFVQLAPFMKIEPEPTESGWAELREAQSLTLKAVPNTGQAVITDLGEENDIHPKQKAPVGQRLALAALALAYKERVVYSGPVYESMRIDGNRIILKFKHAGSGLEAKGSALTGFAIAGADRKFYNAEARIIGKDRVLVTKPTVLYPVAVRYGWANYPVVNLYNKEGLPASPFRTDDFPMVTGPKP